MPDTWATVADVLNYAKASVEDADVFQAQANIDLAAGRIYADAERIGARDKYWLKLAVAYQAAWLAAQPDAFERLDVTSTGGSQSTDGTDTWLVLGPFAKVALRRVSWLRSRSLRVKAPYENSDNRREVCGDDDVDPSTWTPI